MQINRKLTAIAIRNATAKDNGAPRYYGDGGGLWLRVTRTSASWVFRYKVAGKGHEHGLGSVATYSLAEARQRARDCRKLRDDGKDPIALKQAQRLAARAASAKLVTFQEMAEIYIQKHASEWSNLRHCQQWTNSLAQHVFPVIGAIDIRLIDTPHILHTLEMIWGTRRVTAERVRGRIEKILDAAAAAKLRDGDRPNPARWKGHLQTLLAAKANDGGAVHQKAMSYGQVPAFVARLLAYREEGQPDEAPVAAYALAFTILCASRTDEVLGLPWSEIADDVWVIPPPRMKGRRLHTVPVPGPGLAILEKMQQRRQEGCPFVFHDDRGRRLPAAAMRLILRALGVEDAVVHGFRGAFATFAAEKTTSPFEIRESCLAHKIGTAVSQSYNHSDFLEKRRELLETWAAFVTDPVPEKGKVVQLRGRG